MINPIFNKEQCRYCSKNISIGQPIAECDNCNNVIHTKCFVKARYQIIETKCYCTVCADRRGSIYNPFAILCDASNDHDKFYDSEPGDTIQGISKISHILDNCKFIEDFSQLNNYFVENTKCKNIDYFSTLFLNIDGNKSNFDDFLAYFSLISDNELSVLGLAETNIDHNSKDLFNIPTFQSF